MAKIRTLGTAELKQVLTLLERFKGDDFRYEVLERFRGLYLPFHWINHLLPLGLKFLPDIYVAVSEKQVLGLIWLSQDGARSERWKIDQVIINPDLYGAYDMGRQLIYYAVNKLGGQGVETFIAHVDPQYDEGLALLKDCGFRHCSKMHTYSFSLSSQTITAKAPVTLQGLREATGADARKLQELHSETLSPEVRVSLRKSPPDLMPGFLESAGRKCRGEFFKRWVLSGGSRDYLSASIALRTTDYKTFELFLIVSPAYEHLTEDLLAYGMHKISQCAQNAHVEINAYEFQKHKRETLEKVGFSRQTSLEVLVKDYWMPVKDNGERARNPVLLFARSGRTSPA